MNRRQDPALRRSAERIFDNLASRWGRIRRGEYGIRNPSERHKRDLEESTEETMREIERELRRLLKKKR